MGNSLQLVNRETGEVFGTGVIKQLRIKTLGTLEATDWEGHEKFDSEEAMYATYLSYYGDTVRPDTEVKIINFSFKSI